MRRRVNLAVALIALLVGALIIAASTRATTPDVEAPPGLAQWVEPARQAARDRVGLVAMILPLHLSGTNCDSEGATAAFRFEAGGRVARVFVILDEAVGPEATSPGATTVMVALSEAEFAAPPDAFGERLVFPCD